ncbi:carboxylesterase family protein [Novosphingobium resinovorum]
MGDLRWRAPAPALPWTGTRKTETFGHACPQPGGEMARGMAQSEDCLTLNVWSGAKPGSGEKRPVYVWIYGGGFIGGTGASPEFDGEGLAKKGVVVVTFNYRVGALGFLATPELSKESRHGASGNYGLLDDIAALQWVQRNIEAFGGDPAQVTIGGQSAGGSVGFLSMSPLARGCSAPGSPKATRAIRVIPNCATFRSRGARSHRPRSRARSTPPIMARKPWPSCARCRGSR